MSASPGAAAPAAGGGSRRGKETSAEGSKGPKKPRTSGPADPLQDEELLEPPVTRKHELRVERFRSADMAVTAAGSKLSFSSSLGLDHQKTIMADHDPDIPFAYGAQGFLFPIGARAGQPGAGHERFSYPVHGVLTIESTLPRPSGTPGGLYMDGINFDGSVDEMAREIIRQLKEDKGYTAKHEELNITCTNGQHGKIWHCAPASERLASNICSCVFPVFKTVETFNDSPTVDGYFIPIPSTNLDTDRFSAKQQSARCLIPEALRQGNRTICHLSALDMAARRDPRHLQWHPEAVRSVAVEQRAVGGTLERRPDLRGGIVLMTLANSVYQKAVVTCKDYEVDQCELSFLAAGGERVYLNAPGEKAQWRFEADTGPKGRPAGSIVCLVRVQSTAVLAATGVSFLSNDEIKQRVAREGLEIPFRLKIGVVDTIASELGIDYPVEFHNLTVQRTNNGKKQPMLYVTFPKGSEKLLQESPGVFLMTGWGDAEVQHELARDLPTRLREVAEDGQAEGEAEESKPVTAASLALSRQADNEKSAARRQRFLGKAEGGGPSAQQAQRRIGWQGPPQQQQQQQGNGAWRQAGHRRGAMPSSTAGTGMPHSEGPPAWLQPSQQPPPGSWGAPPNYWGPPPGYQQPPMAPAGTTQPQDNPAATSAATGERRPIRMFGGR